MDRSEKEQISQLPDYAALKKLAAGLWRQDSASHGAAIMVGAGFSRAAAITIDSNKKLPLWVHLSSVLANDLGADANGDPLRLAEEYEAYFGKPALHDLIRQQVNDAAWIPGNLHKKLLKFPWSDVLTTNWDSLLERGAATVMDPVYNVVSKAEDLASSPAPRIIKLHGTINVSEELIFTQEDYRKYPENYAAFVNLARQIFIENELCLLGFSGDDPNFLQWAGWVRDKLSPHARRIYLVGPLNLTASKRRYLESINIAPIDLGAIVAEYDDLDTKHFKATEAFLNSLAELKPHAPWDWAPTQLHGSITSSEELEKSRKDENFAASLFEKQLPILKSDRESYPNWVACPVGIRFALQNQISAPYPNKTSVMALRDDLRTKLLYEIAWRHLISYEIPRPWLANELFNLLDPIKNSDLIKKQQLEVAILLLDRALWLDDEESQQMASDVIRILEQNIKFWPGAEGEIALHKSRAARNKNDFSQLEKMVVTISQQDPVHKLKKAAILAELGRFDEAEQLVKNASHELSEQYRNSRNSVYVISRLAWATWLVRAISRWEPENPFNSYRINFQEAKSNPWDHIDYIRDRIDKSIEQQSKDEIIPSFEPGRYTDRSTDIYISNEIHPLVLLQGVADSVGIPFRMDGMNILLDKTTRLAKLKDLDDLESFSLALRSSKSGSDELIKQIFSRIRMASIPQNVADELLTRCINAVDFWRNKLLSTGTTKRSFALTRLEIFLEVLARSMVRAAPERAKQSFRLAIEIGKIPAFQNFDLHDSLGHLIEYSLKSVPQSEHCELVLDALSFPLKNEIEANEKRWWPNPVIENPGERLPNPSLDRRIDEIIESVNPCSPASAPALLRLLPLSKADFLNKSEREKCGKMIWGADKVSFVPPEVGLPKSILLDLPSPDLDATNLAINKYVFERNDATLFDENTLTSIINSIHVAGEKQYPTKDQAANYFHRLTEWRPSKGEHDYLGTQAASDKKISSLIGEALSQVVVPQLSTKQLTTENFDKLISFYREAKSTQTLVALVYFAPSSSETSKAVNKLIKKGLQDKDSSTAAFSSFALLKWRGLSADEGVLELVSRLVHVVESGRGAGLAALLWTVKELLKGGQLEKFHIENLIDSIPVTFGSADYKVVSPVSREAVSVSLLRAACVDLARELIMKSNEANEDLQAILQEARLDPLPEVRFSGLSGN